MPAPGKRWRHVIINTYCSWHHGDPRGFRYHKHRIHSSGDYRKPPPVGEHAGLHAHRLARAHDPVRVAEELRGIVGRALVERLTEDGHRVLACAVSAEHAHLLVELPVDRTRVRVIVGDAKRVASRALTDQMPGRVWSAGGEYRLIKDRAHLLNAYRYILTRQGEKAWTWSFRRGGR